MGRSLGIKRLRVGVVSLVLYLAVCVLVNLSLQKSTLEMAAYRTTVASLTNRIHEPMSRYEIDYLGEILQSLSVGGDLSKLGLDFNVRPLNYYLEPESFDMSATQDLIRDGRLRPAAAKLELLAAKVDRVYKRRLRLLRYLAYLALIGVVVLLGFVAWSSFRTRGRVLDEISMPSESHSDDSQPTSFSDYLNSVVTEEVKFTGNRASVACKGFDVETKDPIMFPVMEQVVEHMVRNSVEHGGRAAEKRLLAGKTDHLSIRVNLQDEPDQWLISVWDNGEGIDSSEVIDTALKLGLIGESVVPEISADNALKLIFLKGFTTRDTATSVADGDLGLDDLRRLVKAHSGVFSIQNLPGKSCQFSVKFPKSSQAR